MTRKSIAGFGLIFLGMVLGTLLPYALRLEQAKGAPQITLSDPANTTNLVSNNPIHGVGQAPQGQVASPFAGFLMQNGFVAMSPEEALHISIYETANRGVVNISTSAVRPETLLLATEIEGNGSGIVLDQQGHVLTNYHVISDSQKISVTLFNGEVYPATLVGQDPHNDVAVIQVSAPETSLFPIPMGDSSNLKVGQHIVAIGNPFGLERTMTTGIISSLNRQITSKTGRKIHSIVQIDAALNQGNSGGPLLNSRGELIGMNTAIATRSGDNAGIGFAIPINTIKRVVTQLLTTGRVVRPTIGILQVFEIDRGLLVVNVTPNGPAEKAGIKGSKMGRRRTRLGLTMEFADHSQADIIVGIDEKQVKSADDLLSVIESKRPGDQVLLTVIRGGRLQQVPVALAGDQ
jgi:S1-C subfamily serine protease